MVSMNTIATNIHESLLFLQTTLKYEAAHRNCNIPGESLQPWTMDLQIFVISRKMYRLFTLVFCVYRLFTFYVQFLHVICNNIQQC